MNATPPNPVLAEDFAAIRKQPIEWDRFEGKRILVTGAAGFLPAYLVDFLHYLGEEGGPECHLIGLVRNEAKAARRFGHLGASSRFQLLVQDVCSPLPALPKIDFLIHAASQASPKFYGADPLGTFQANGLATNNLLALARQQEVESFLFFSSGEVYGQVPPEKVPIREEDYGYVDPAALRSCYAEGKRAGETLCVCWHHQHGVPTRIVRPFHTYGPGMALDDGRVYADFVADVLAGRDITIKSDGRARRAYCYLADAAAGFLKVLLDGENAKPYNIGNPSAEVSVAELAGVLTTIAGEIFPDRSPRILWSNAPRGEGYLESPISRNSPDISCSQGLGWKPWTSLQEGFRRTILSYL